MTTRVRLRSRLRYFVPLVMICELVRIEWQNNAWPGILEVKASLLRSNFIRNQTNLIDRDVRVCLQLFGIANSLLGDGLTGFDVLDFDSMTCGYKMIFADSVR